MKKKLQLDLMRANLPEGYFESCSGDIGAGLARLHGGSEAFTGWVKLPANYDRKELNRIILTAEKIRGQCEAFVVIGIGGSYLGARAAVEMMGHNLSSMAMDKNGKNSPEIYFAGQNLSGTYHAELLEKLKEKEVCLCVISKSGTTTEPSIAFAVLKDFLIEKYGKEEASSRIYAVTDGKKGVLREEADGEGYESFIVPDDIGGRYSVLTPVGLLPIAVAGIDVREMLAGAEEVYATEAEQKKNPIALAAQRYAAARFSLMSAGKAVEIFEYYEPKLQYFAEWLKQLFGESEGKEGRGLFPAALQFSADLHSMGQFLQEGSQIFFETVINVENPEKDLIVPKSAGQALAGRSVNAVNQAAVTGVMEAHRSAGIPIIKIDIPDLTPRTFGQMVYFFESTCALTGYLMGVNPFDQPGVERYKAEMKKAMDK